jgi:hypothetical protein
MRLSKGCRGKTRLQPIRSTAIWCAAWLTARKRKALLAHTAAKIAGGLLTGGLGASGRVNSLSEAARVGAIQGGIAGFGYGEGAGGSLLGAAVGAPTGALLSTGFQAAGNKIQNALASRRTPVDPAKVQSVVDAGERRGVTVRRPDVDPNIRNQRAAVQQTDQGRSAIAAADQNDIGEIETALIRDLGGQQGATRTGAATGVQQGVKAARGQSAQASAGCLSRRSGTGWQRDCAAHQCGCTD